MQSARDAARPSDDREATEQTRATVSAFLRALSHGGRYGDHLAEDATHTLMETGEVAHGRDAIVGLVDHLHHQAFAGSPIVRSLVAEGSRAAVEGEFVGRHVGEFAGIAPTGRTVRVPFAAAYDLAGGTIGALRVYLPMDALVRQLRAT